MRATPLLATALPLLVAAAARAEGTHWSYDGDSGPAHWAELDAGWGLCATGQHQSPVDIAGAAMGGVDGVTPDWPADVAWTVVNNGHTIEARPQGPAGGITIGGVRYDLAQFHFHLPSEHAVGGARAAMEVHFVHKSAEGALAVIGVMLRGGGAAGPLDAVMAAAPAHEGEAEGGVIDPHAFLPDEGTFVRYEGSLTTPPCTEGVTWTVMSRSVEVSDAAIQSFAAIFPHDARPLQALHERVLASN